MARSMMPMRSGGRPPSPRRRGTSAGLVANALVPTAMGGPVSCVWDMPRRTRPDTVIAAGSPGRDPSHRGRRAVAGRAVAVDGGPGRGYVPGRPTASHPPVLIASSTRQLDRNVRRHPRRARRWRTLGTAARTPGRGGGARRHSHPAGTTAAWHLPPPCSACLRRPGRRRRRRQSAPLPPLRGRTPARRAVMAARVAVAAASRSPSSCCSSWWSRAGTPASVTC